MGNLRRQIAAALPNVEVTEYDSEERGIPDSRFDWSLYSVAVMTYELGQHDQSTDWLRDLAGLSAFPPTLLIAHELDVYTTVELMRAGVGDILLRQDISSADIGQRMINLALLIS